MKNLYLYKKKKKEPGRVDTLRLYRDKAVKTEQG